jgi:hypothetical protein
MASDVSLESLVNVEVKDQRQARFESAARDRDSKKRRLR